uniref:TATA element modulatory factor 1 n=1 Tax=Neogobius melanostomus TaxID=47308 RepID=A0A8C6UQR3_9GOBI
MSWFNTSHLSSFAKQALTTAQKSIDRVLDIKEEDQWGDTTLSLSGGWGLTQWEAPPEEKTPATPPSSEAITTPVTRTVVDESENFFSAFLSPGDVQILTNSQVVSVPPSKSQRRLQEEDTEDSDVETDTTLQKPGTADTLEESLEDAESQPAEPTSPDPCPDTILLQPVSPASSCATLPLNSDSDETKPSAVKLDNDVAETEKAEELPTQVTQTVAESSKPTAVAADSNSSAPPDSPPPSKEVALEQKDPKTEDRQNDTPSPPVSAFSSGTSTTSDIEVLDHDSVLSESSASSRQETAEGKAGLHLMQGSFQLLTASTCGDFPRMEDYPKLLTESCGSSSDAFERIDSFSMQSLDSRSVSEVNSDDEIPGSRTLASVTAAPLTVVAPSVCEKQDEVVVENTLRGEDEMEESGRSATPVNTEQPEDLLDQESEANLTLVIDELTGRLEKRESQLLVVSKDKARLEEECDNLKDEVISLKEESSTVQSLKEEFTQRIADAERKAQLACKERDIAKKVNFLLTNSVNTMEIIKEKEDQIRGLLEEGDCSQTPEYILSKQQLQHSNIIKNSVRFDNIYFVYMLSCVYHTVYCFELMVFKVLDGKEEVEKQHRENIKKLNGVVEKQEKEISRVQADSDELQEKNRSLQSALDNAYKELAELHKANASRVSEAEEAALSREIKAKEQLSLTLEKAQEEAKVQQEALANQVADLRLALQRAEQQQARKEDYLRDEISELQQRLQEAESRNQELSQSIENLQASLGGQTASWEKLEKNISDRLADAQAQLAVAVEKERAASEELLSIKSQLASLESQNSLLRQEKSRVLAQLDAEKNKKEKLEDESSRHLVELQNLRGEHTRIIEETKRKREKERREPPASSTPSLSRSSSISGVDNAGLHTSVLSQDDMLDHSLGNVSLSVSMSGTNLYEAARLSGGSSIIENLQSQLKLREGEIAQLQLEIGNLERSRSVMAEELVRLTNQNDEMEEKVAEIPTLRVQLKDLEQRHNTILQMYGEKAEEAEELRLDLEDVKNMYKTQIDELLKNQK